MLWLSEKPITNTEGNVANIINIDFIYWIKNKNHVEMATKFSKLVETYTEYVNILL